MTQPHFSKRYNLYGASRSRFSSAFIFIWKVSWMMNCQDIRVPFRDRHSGQGLRHPVRHSQNGPNATRNQTRNLWSCIRQIHARKRWQSVLLAMLAEFRRIVRLPGNKKKDPRFFFYSFTPFSSTAGVTGRRERGGDTETGDHVAKVVEPGSEHVTHFTHVSGKASTR